MYLKCLELVGFKSFAERTRLDFEPGLISIVGPNGCGKSNISDAVRWVLGEQSARALRGGQMTDVIFNGTDSHKPLGMAEVSLTLADCESLGLEYREVTVTRRVFRSGEGQYLVNKTPCRLKDIQRLFMDTGIGTSSYALMEQGKIDRILSSRPEDRRSVFEEASGITKFKADKKEALRKLEHTEANLLRLADILREVKRQIISLQRQAGKARRYQEIQTELRALDVFFARDRLQRLDADLAALEEQHRTLAGEEETLRREVTAAEDAAAAIRAALNESEATIAAAMEHAVQARNELERTREAIRLNDDRRAELRQLSEREHRDVEEAQARLTEHGAALTELESEIEQATAARAQAEQALTEKSASLRDHENRFEEQGRALHQQRQELLQLEARQAQLQREISETDARERAAIIRRERLLAEQAGVQAALQQAQARQAELDGRAEALRAEIAARQQALQEWRERRRHQGEEIARARQELAELRSRAAARRAQVDMLERGAAAAEDFPGGARLLLDPHASTTSDRSALLGALAQHLRAEPEYRPALEAALRPWLDAIVVRDGAAALDLLRELDLRRAGSARLLAVTDGADAPPPQAGPGLPLLDFIRCDPEIRPLAERLLGAVRVVDALDPAAPAGLAQVTRSGQLARGGGAYEIWMPEAQESNPLARQQQLAEWREDLVALDAQVAEREARLTSLQSDEQTFGAEMEQRRQQLDDIRRQFNICEGEGQVIARDTRAAQQRVETVGYELQAVERQHQGGQERRQQIHAELEQLGARQDALRTGLSSGTEELRTLEQSRIQWMTAVNEGRLAAAETRQRCEHLAQRRGSLQARRRELEALIVERQRGMTTYEARIAELEQQAAAARDSLEPLEAEMNLHQQRLETARRERETRGAELTECDRRARDCRGRHEAWMQRKSDLDIRLAEARLRRQNLLDRVTGDYRISAEDVRRAPEPEWGEAGPPADQDALETRIAELRAKLESMGPVNLVAIEEHQQLEERYAFLSQQNDDLVNSKQQLMELIKKINATTTTLFAETFEKVNRNFGEMFVKLFGGGAAKLVLVDEADVLESGIEIIARPPGKKLQTVSLLSGGERTMTAVALLFALYLVKPSPFCVLDELDAALDDTNIGRFVQVVRDFVKQSQFVVITHNRQTIAASNALYGVTMEQHGVSKIVSVKFNREGRVEHTTEPIATPEETAIAAADVIAEPDPADIAAAPVAGEEAPT